MIEVSEDEASQEDPPRVFLSYSWSSTEYMERVVRLAEQLVADGVEVVFDRWDLREGQDKHAFMERAVTDPAIFRVLILCDPLYAEKADGRRGGVGTETLIVSPEVYREADQKKFIPVIMERDNDGIVRVPRYLEGRIYIDLSTAELESHEYERLVRNIYGKPELRRPAIGKPPRYLEDDAAVLQTGRALVLFQDAVRRNRPFSKGMLEDYLDRLVDAVKAELPDPADRRDFAERALESIEGFVLYRDEFLDLIRFLTRYAADKRYFEALHSFFERLAQLRRGYQPGRWGDMEVDNIGFITWELFLYTVARMLRGDQAESLNMLLHPFYLTSPATRSGSLRSFSGINRGFRLIDEVHNRALGTRYHSLSASILKDRTTHRDFPFDSLMEADLLLWFRAAMDEDYGGHWYPRTLVYAEMMEDLPLFRRAESRAIFNKLAPALGVDSAAQFANCLEQLPDAAFFPVGDFWGDRESYKRLFRVESLASKA